MSRLGGFCLSPSPPPPPPLAATPPVSLFSLSLSVLQDLTRDASGERKRHPVHPHIQWRRNDFESGEGSTCPVRSAEKNLSCPSTFLALHVRFGERFRDGQYIFVSFLFDPVPRNLKSGGTCPCVTWFRRNYPNGTSCVYQQHLLACTTDIGKLPL